MIVWLIKAGEPTPVDPGVPRLMRTGNLAQCLADRGHTAIWWTAAFDHQRKAFRRLMAPTASVDPRFSIRFVRSLGYAKNVSLRRWFDDIWLAVAMYRQMSREGAKPDVIVCAYPLIFASIVAVAYGKRNKRPVIVDVRDMWPDIWVTLTRGPLSLPYRLFAFLNRALAGVSSAAPPVLLQLGMHFWNGDWSRLRGSEPRWMLPSR